jgi:hypothetical protein
MTAIPQISRLEMPRTPALAAYAGDARSLHFFTGAVALS